MEEKDTAEGIVKNILYFFSVPAIVEGDVKDGIIKIDIETKDSAVLIGYRGESLRALQYITNLLFRNDIEDGPKVVVDVGGYKKDQDNKLMEFGRSIAIKVVEGGQEEALRPMTAYERRLIHTVVADYPELESISEGEAPYKRVVIKKK